MANKTLDLDPIFGTAPATVPEAELVQQVLEQALLEATSPRVRRRWASKAPSERAVTPERQRDARLWILTRGGGAGGLAFDWCCESLGVDPEQVRQAVVDDPAALYARLCSRQRGRYVRGNHRRQCG